MITPAMAKDIVVGSFIGSGGDVICQILEGKTISQIFNIEDNRRRNFGMASFNALYMGTIINIALFLKYIDLR